MNIFKNIGKYTLAIITCALLSLGVSAVAEGEVPPSVKDNCLLNDQGYIDSCPNTWERVKEINTLLKSTRTQQEDAASSLKDIQLATSKMFIQSNSMKKKLMMARSWKGENQFTVEYMMYMIGLYQKELQQNTTYKGVAEKLFQKTYFAEKQSGLTITDVELYKDAPVPSVYDESVTLQIAIRNFAPEAITQVEDLYCFASQAGEDYIFPLQMQGEMFKANSITNIIGSLYMGDNEIMNIPGDKTLHCMLVYTKDGKEETSPFVSFDFLVE